MIAVAGTHAHARGVRRRRRPERRSGLAALTAPERRVHAVTETSYPSPRALLDQYDLRAKKSWGQNFLGDEAVLDDIARLAAPAPGGTVVELGAGLGHLTARLLARGARWSRRWSATATWRGCCAASWGTGITLLEADAARLDWPALARSTVRPAARAAPAAGGGRQPALPPHLAHPLLAARRRALDGAGRSSCCSARWRSGWRRRPGDTDYGLLSVLPAAPRRGLGGAARAAGRLLAAAQGRLGGPLRRSSARPPRPVLDAARFRKLVKAGFGQRRKTLRNALEAGGWRPGAPGGGARGRRHRPGAARRDADGGGVGRAGAGAGRRRDRRGAATPRAPVR